MQLDPKALEAAFAAAEDNAPADSTYGPAIKAAIRAYLEAAPSPSPAPVVVVALREAKKRFIAIENCIARNLFHQQEKIKDAQSIATDGWSALDVALSSLSQPAKEREGGGLYGTYTPITVAASTSTPANPAQGVREALSDCLDMLARFTHSTSNDLNHVEARAVYRAGRAALAAIGAGRSSEPEFETAPDNGTPAEVLAYVLECARRWVPEARIIGNARAGDIERAIAAIGAGGQVVACQWRKRDRVMKHEENWSYVDYHTGLKIAEHPEKYEVRPLYTHPAPSGQAVEALERLRDATPQSTNTVSADGAFAYVHAVAATALSALSQPPAQPGWRSMDSAPKDGTKIQVWADGYEWPEIIYYERYDDATAAEAGSDGYWRYADDLFADVAEVEADTLNYWQPLPAAPLPGGAK